MVDVFDEVEEELRAERYTQLVRKGWPYAAGAVILALLVTLGIWGYGQHQKSEQAKASLTYDQGLQSLQASDLEGADRKFASLAASAPAGYRTLALMQQAGIRNAKGKTEEAARLMDQAAKVAPDNILGDAARLKAVWLLMDTKPLAEIEQRLTPLIEDKRPFHLQAREALANARLQAGKPQLAQGDLTVLTLAQDVSPSTRASAEAAQQLIKSGSAGALPAAVTAKPAPQPVQPPAGLPPGLLAGATQ